MNSPRLSHRIRLAGLTFVLALSASGCNATAPEALSIHGSWTGSVAERELELTLVLIGQGETGINGLAELTSPSTGMVHGGVSGSMNGSEVSLTIEIDGAIIAGSLTFEGAFQGEDTITGTLSSGLLEGSWPMTLQKEEV